MIATSKYTFDAFISHSDLEKDWVDGELLPLLKKAGLRCYAASTNINTYTSNIYFEYRKGLARLFGRLDKKFEKHEPSYQEALSYEQQLYDNIDHSLKNGDTEMHRSDRARIISQLNALATRELDISFNELCSPEIDRHIKDSIEPSRWILLILSSEWVHSEWPRLEKLLQSSDKNIIPLLHEPCKPPPFIDERAYADFTGSEIRESELKRVVDAIRRASKLGDGRISITAGSQRVVIPGNGLAIPILIDNQGPLDEHFQGKANGLSDEWVSVSPPDIEVSSGEKREMYLIVAPPRSPAIHPGSRSLTAQIISQDIPSRIDQLEESVIIGDFCELSVDLNPKDVESGNTTRITISNQGNIERQFTLSCEEPSGQLRFNPYQHVFTLGPGKSNYVDIQASAPSGFQIGAKKEYSFLVRVDIPAEGSQTYSGVVIKRTSIPIWLILLVILVPIIGIGYIFFPRQPISLTIDNLQDRYAIDAEKTFEGHYSGILTEARLWGVTRDKSGLYTLHKPKVVQPGAGEWEMEATFGSRTSGIGAQYAYSVIVTDQRSTADKQLAELTAPISDLSEILQKALYSTEPITVTRAGPTDRWNVDYWQGTQPGTRPISFTENLNTRFIFKDWKTAAPGNLREDEWSARFVRQIYFPQDGTYRFYAEHDDGVRVEVDGDQIIDDWNDTVLKRTPGSKELMRGYHNVTVEFYDQTEEARLGFWYEGPEQAAPPPPPEATSYWLVTYYPNIERSGDPVWYELHAPNKLAIDWGENGGLPIGSPAATEVLTDTFSTRAIRQVAFQKGFYRFDVKADDSVKLIIRDEQGNERVLFEGYYVSDDCNPCSRLIDLEEQTYTIIVEQWEYKQSAHISLEWQPVSPQWASLSNPYATQAIAVDQQFVWTGGGGGLVRWNKNTSASDDIFHSEDGLADNRVSGLLVDISGALWVGSGEGSGRGGSGLARFDGDQWKGFTTADGLCDNGMFRIYQDPQDDSLWIGTGWGLSHYYLESRQWQCYRSDDGLASNFPNSIYRDRHGDLWVTMGGAGPKDDKGAVSELQSDGTWRTFDADEIGTDRWGLGDIAEDTAGHLWFSSSHGAFRYDGQHWQAFTIQDGLPSDDIQALASDSHGGIWFGTSNGLARYDGNRWITYTSDNELLSNNVTGLTFDQDGTLWVAHANGGISSFDGRRWVLSDTPSRSTAPNRIISVTQAKDGKLWFGTGLPWEGSGDGVHAYQPDQQSWEVFNTSNTSNGLKRDDIKAIESDKDGNLWFGYGFGDGVTRFDGQSWDTFTKDNGLAGDMVGDILRTHDGNLWFATSDGGVSLYTYDTEEWQTFNTSNGGLPSDDADILYEDSKNHIWIGIHDKGVVRYDGQNWSAYTTDQGLISNQVSAIVEDTDGRIWFGTDKGISVYDLKQNAWSTHQEEDGLLSDHVLSMYRDRNGWIWIGTPDGLNYYTNQSLHTFTPADGLAGRHIQAIWEDGQGDLWFGTGSGISHLQFKPRDN